MLFEAFLESENVRYHAFSATAVGLPGFLQDIEWATNMSAVNKLEWGEAGGGLWHLSIRKVKVW